MKKRPTIDVDLLLLVALAGFELQGDALEHDAPLRLLRRDLGEAPVAEEGAQHGFLVVVGGAEGESGVARRSDLLGGPAQGLGVEPIGVPVVVHAHDARCAVRRFRCLCTLAIVTPVAAASSSAERSPARERAGDRQPLRVGEGAEDLVRGLGHVGPPAYHARVQLTDPQRRTLDGLIGTGDRPIFPADLAQRLRDRIEGAARELELAEPLWLGKEKLNQHGRCEGLFRSVLAGEAPPFAHSARSAHGVLLHKAIEVEVGARDGMDPHEVAQVAVGRVLEREERFADYWRELSASEQDDALMEVVRRVTLFQGSFPPLKPLRRELVADQRAPGAGRAARRRPRALRPDRPRAGRCPTGSNRTGRPGSWST